MVKEVVFEDLKKIYYDRWLKDKGKDNLKQFKEAIKELNKISFLLTSASCSGHINKRFKYDKNEKDNHTRGFTKKERERYINEHLYDIEAEKDYHLVRSAHLKIILVKEHSKTKKFVNYFKNEISKLSSKNIEYEINSYLTKESGLGHDLDYEMIKLVVWMNFKEGLLFTNIKKDFRAKKVFTVKKEDKKIIENEIKRFWIKVKDIAGKD